jgi:hypothetical protein
MNDGHPPQPHRSAGIASVEEGLVVLDGPDGIAITLTAEAAIATGESLVAAGRKLQQQQRRPDGP